MSILLELDLTGAIVEDVGSHPIERVVNRRRLALRTLINRLASAAEDPNVVGLLAKLGATSISLAQAQELADAVGRFRARGKEAIAWAETFGELGRATTAYVVATGFGELWLQPSGSIGLMGAAASGTFVRGALDQARVEPLFAQRHEYKNAADTFLRSEFSEAHREVTERLAESAYEQIVAAVSAGRRLPSERVPKPRRRASSITSGTATQFATLWIAAGPTSRHCSISRAIKGAGTASASCAGRAVPRSGSSRRSVPSGSAGPSRVRSDGQRVRTPSPRRSAPR